MKFLRNASGDIIAELDDALTVEYGHMRVRAAIHLGERLFIDGLEVPAANYDVTDHIR